MPTYEGLRLKILKYWRLGLANYRKKQLKSTNFTIISNNCWGGMIYESYNLPKESPTVGMFFIAKDYIEFLSDLKGYVNGKLTFISPTKSRWKDIPQISEDKRFGSYPVGVLSNGKNSNSMSSVAREMLRNVPDIPVNDKIFLQRISEYRKHRLWLLKNATKNIGNSEALSITSQTVPISITMLDLPISRDCRSLLWRKVWMLDLPTMVMQTVACAWMRRVMSLPVIISCIFTAVI